MMLSALARSARSLRWAVSFGALYVLTGLPHGLPVQGAPLGDRALTQKEERASYLKASNTDSGDQYGSATHLLDLRHEFASRRRLGRQVGNGDVSALLGQGKNRGPPHAPVSNGAGD